jgi:hypothetical protein
VYIEVITLFTKVVIKTLENARWNGKMVVAEGKLRRKKDYRGL